MRRHEGPSPKSLDSDEILSSNIRYFVAVLRFVVIYAFMKHLLRFKCKTASFCPDSDKKDPTCLQIRAKTTFFVAILVIRAKTMFFCRKLANTRTEEFFCVCRKPANFCHPCGDQTTPYFFILSHNMSSNMDATNLAIVNDKMMSVKRNQAEAANSKMRRG